MAWRVARSLDTLLGQLNTEAPKRSKLSDGSIGDAAHATRDSDHNPWIKLGSSGIVTARDFTNDPAGGLDCNWLAKVLVASGDPRIKYIIWNRRIWTAKSGWVAYNGTNPHDHHLHLSVSVQPGWFDSTLPWALGAASPATRSPLPSIPIPVRLPNARSKKMYLIRDAGPEDVRNAGAVYLVTDDGLRHLNSEEWACFQWLLDDDRDPDAAAPVLGRGDTANQSSRFLDVIAAVLARPVSATV